MQQKIWVIFYQIKKWIPYKQEADFVRYLSHRDGLVTPESYPMYYILHSNPEHKDRAEEFIDQKIVRRFVYVPSFLSPVAPLIGLVRASMQLRHSSTTKYLIINNTFHQIALHALARLIGWNSVKIAGTFFGSTAKGWKRIAMRCYESIHFFLARTIVVLSPSGLDYVDSPFLRKTVYTVPNFLYDAPPRPEASSKKFSHRAVCVSRLEPEKNLLDLVKAWAQVKEPWTLDIYGDGSLRNTFEEAIKKNHLQNRVHLHSALVHAEVFQILPRYDVFVLTSLCEGLGIAYLEAMYMRVPAVGLDVPGVRDSLGSHRGVLLAPMDWQNNLDAGLTQAMNLGKSDTWQEATNAYFTSLSDKRRDLSEIVDSQ